MQEQEKETLYIPLGLKTRTELFEGFGKEEMYQAVFINTFAVIFDIVFYSIAKNVAVTIIFMITSIAASIMVLTKDKSNVSVLDQIKFLVRFFRAQKIYPYRACKEWEV